MCHFVYTQTQKLTCCFHYLDQFPMIGTVQNDLQPFYELNTSFWISPDNIYALLKMRIYLHYFWLKMKSGQVHPKMYKIILGKSLSFCTSVCNSQSSFWTIYWVYSNFTLNFTISRGLMISGRLIFNHCWPWLCTCKQCGKIKICRNE